MDVVERSAFEVQPPQISAFTKPEIGEVGVTKIEFKPRSVECPISALDYDHGCANVERKHPRVNHLTLRVLSDKGSQGLHYRPMIAP